MFRQVVDTFIQPADHWQEVGAQHKVVARVVQHSLSRLKECEEAESVGQV